MSKAFDQVGVMHTSLSTTSTTNSECREVREKAEEELGSEVNKSEGDSLKFEIYFQYVCVK
jgi:hypothetical protein